MSPRGLAFVVLLPLATVACASSPPDQIRSPHPDVTHAVASDNGCRFDQTLWKNGWSVSIQTGAGQGCAEGTWLLTVVSPAGRTERFNNHRDGVVENVWLADLAHDGNFEIVLEIRSPGDDSFARIFIYQMRAGRFAQAPMARLAPVLEKAYAGHDRYEVINDDLYRAFPLFRDGDRRYPMGVTARFRYDFRRAEWDRIDRQLPRAILHTHPVDSPHP